MSRRIILTLLAALAVGACRRHQNNENKIAATPTPIVKTQTRQIRPVVTDSIYTRNDSICIVSAGKITRIPKITDINQMISVKSLIETDGRSIKKYNLLRLNKYIYFTVFDTSGGTMGRGHFNLYVFDTATRCMVWDNQFKSNHLAGDGKFIIDRKANRLFDIGSDMNVHTTSVVAIGSVIGISNDRFRFFKNVYQENISLDNDSGDEDDSLVLKFYNHSLANGALHGKLLPKNWWK